MSPHDPLPQDQSLPQTGPLGWAEMFDSGKAPADSIVPFLGTAHALAAAAGTVVDVGCGRGSWAGTGPNPVAFHDLRGPGRTVIGIDVDPAAAVNPMIDEFRLIEDVAHWPVEDSSVDLAVSDFTLEHVEDPREFVAELARVLRPGGAFVARTVSRRSPLAIAARAVPNRRHARVLTRVQPDREAQDVFPTMYRMNSDRALRELFDADFDWRVAHLGGLDQYLLRWRWAARAASATEPHLPRALRTTLVVFARRK